MDIFKPATDQALLLLNSPFLISSRISSMTGRFSTDLWLEVQQLTTEILLMLLERHLDHFVTASVAFC